MEESGRAARRPHSAELKAQVLSQCTHPGALVAAVAQAHGLNANLVHKWRRAAQPSATRSAAVMRCDEGVGSFVALQLTPNPAPAAVPDIRIELRRGGTTASISWPAAAAGECAAWLREWLR